MHTKHWNFQHFIKDKLLVSIICLVVGDLKFTVYCYVAWLDSVTSSRMGSPTDFVTSRKSTLSSTQLFTASTKRTTSSSFGSSGLLDSVAVSTLASGFCQPSFGSMVQLPDVVPTREEWMKDEEVAACVICVQRFSMVRKGSVD